MGSAGSRPDVNADSRFPCKGRIAIFGRRPIWIKGPHGAGTAPFAALAGPLARRTRDPERTSPISPSFLTSVNGKSPCLVRLSGRESQQPLRFARCVFKDRLRSVFLTLRKLRKFSVLNRMIDNDSSKRCWDRFKWALLSFADTRRWGSGDKAETDRTVFSKDPQRKLCEARFA